MDIQNRKTLLKAMRILVELTESVTEEGVPVLLNAYNHLHVQLDGQRVIAPQRSKPSFIYDSKSNMVRAS